MSETPAEAWTRCRPYIEAALKFGDGGHDIGDVQAGIEAGDFQFWPGAHCAVVTEIIAKPRLKLLNYWLMGGDLGEFLTRQPDIEAWAAAKGCSRAICGVVRAGWARALAPQGAQARWTIYCKELSA